MSYGFDELLLKNLAMPQTDSTLVYTVTLSSNPTPTSAVCGLADGHHVCAGELRCPGLGHIGHDLAAQRPFGAVRQDLSIFAKLFDRLCSSAGTVWQGTVDRSSVDYWMYDGDLSLRFVPILPFTTEDFTSWIYRIDKSLL